jgi:hypothetical protein
MPTIPDADLLVMAQSPLGDVATIEGTEVSGIFDNEYQVALDIAGTSPAFSCRQTDLDAITPSVARGTNVTINAVVYTIEDPQPEGTGWTVLILSKV